jgi:hypothetical protein
MYQHYWSAKALTDARAMEAQRRAELERMLEEARLAHGGRPGWLACQMQWLTHATGHLLVIAGEWLQRFDPEPVIPLANSGASADACC